MQVAVILLLYRLLSFFIALELDNTEFNLKMFLPFGKVKSRPVELKKFCQKSICKQEM